MKLLTVFVVYISVYCVTGYTIFPLPGQRAAVNPKFGRIDARPLSSAQSVTATKIIPFLSTLPPLPSTSYGTSRFPEEPSSPSLTPPKVSSVSSYQTSKAPEVVIAPTLSTTSTYALSSEKPKTSSLVQNVQSPSRTIAAVKPLATDLLPPEQSSVPETKPETSPIKPEIEPPSKDLLPPKLR